VLTAATVGADDTADSLTGGDGADWFVLKVDSAPDALTDWDAANDVMTNL
jgi:hypothetical protein